MTNSQLNKLRSGIKNGANVNLNLSPNLTGNCHDETHFPHKLLLTNTQNSEIRKAFADGSSNKIRFSKTHCYSWLIYFWKYFIKCS